MERKARDSDSDSEFKDDGDFDTDELSVSLMCKFCYWVSVIIRFCFGKHLVIFLKALWDKALLASESILKFKQIATRRFAFPFF